MPATNREPQFENMLAVLNRQKPSRPVLFELFLNERLYAHFSGIPSETCKTDLDRIRQVMLGFKGAGYDYFNMGIPNFSFPAGQAQQISTRSQNEGAVITDKASLMDYPWQDPASGDWGILDLVARELPAGMKIIVYGPSGVLENAINLIGYEALCLLIEDDPRLADHLFEQVGSRLEESYRLAARHPAVGACISNDDWGFKTQTLFSPRQMRRYVFPWHKRIVSAIHAGGKPAILHSCGHFERIIEDVIEDMAYDARHSFEDAIMPVEESFARFGDRIAHLGGIDLDFLIRSPLEAVTERSRRLLEEGMRRGGYALGTGNSVPYYIPDEAFLAMTKPALL